MGNRNEKVDAYIADAADFLRPILEKLRDLVHTICPDVQETIKWGIPFFEYHGLLAGMAAYKKHVSFGFWKGDLMDDPDGLFEGIASMFKVESANNLPAHEILRKYIQLAMKMNIEDVKPPTRTERKLMSPNVPDDLAAALKKNKKAQANYDRLPPMAQRDYVAWITESKQEATREERLSTAIEWLAEGKRKNWKYVNG